VIISEAIAWSKGAAWRIFLIWGVLLVGGLSLLLDIAIRPEATADFLFLVVLHIFVGLFWGFMIWRFLTRQRENSAP
jgi:hypothetical protein